MGSNTFPFHQATANSGFPPTMNGFNQQPSHFAHDALPQGMIIGWQGGGNDLGTYSQTGWDFSQDWPNQSFEIPPASMDASAFTQLGYPGAMPPSNGNNPNSSMFSYQNPGIGHQELHTMPVDNTSSGNGPHEPLLDDVSGAQSEGYPVNTAARDGFYYFTGEEDTYTTNT